MKNTDLTVLISLGSFVFSVTVLVPVGVLVSLDKENVTNQKVSKGWKEAITNGGESFNIVSYQKLYRKIKIKYHFAAIRLSRFGRFDIKSVGEDIAKQKPSSLISYVFEQILEGVGWQQLVNLSLSLFYISEVYF